MTPKEQVLAKFPDATCQYSEFHKSYQVVALMPNDYCDSIGCGIDEDEAWESAAVYAENR